MSTSKGPTLTQVAEAIIAELDAPIAFDEFVQRILARYQSKAKNPAQAVRANLRYELRHLGIVFLDSKTIVPLRVALKGIRFRIPLDQEQLKHGVIWYDWFVPFYKGRYFYNTPEVIPTLFDTQAEPIPTSLATVESKFEPKQFDGFLVTLLGGAETVRKNALDLRHWLQEHSAQKEDGILVTLLDYERAHFAIEHEPQNQRREPEIQAQNRALADMIWNVLQETTDERLYTNEGIATAYARLSSARDYPGDHWRQVLDDDPRMRNDGLMIVPADYQSWFDLALGEPDTVEEQPFTEEQGQKVYRFSACAKRTLRTCIIEILGKHTLGDFDAVMRRAFHLDTSDHLSEFTLVISRGKGKRPHRTEYGELNPFEDTPARQVHLAGLGLEVGAKLEYVYDFGDWLEHTLILESIGELDPAAKYPRVLPAPQPSRRSKKH